MALKAKPLDLVRDLPEMEDITKEDLVRVNFLVPKSKRQQWKQRALDQERPMRELIIQVMDEYFAK